MPRRSIKSITRRVGAFFGKKPERHVTPHIYISTEKEMKKRKAKAHHVVHAAAAAAPVAVKGAGKLHKVEQSDERGSAVEEASALQDEEGFMQHVKTQKKDRAPHKGIDLWMLVRDRFVHVPAVKKSPAAPVEQIEPVEDSFLKHVTAAPVEPVIRTESATLAPAPLAAAPAQQSAIDEVAERKDEVAKALQENTDIVQTPAPVLAPAPVPTPEKPSRKHVKLPQFQTKQGFSAFLTSLGYIGMGKERALFIQNMAMMLNAGLPLTDSLKTLILETRVRPMRKLITRIVDKVENGSPLWRAMESQSFFSLHALALVRIGEEAGNLAENMGYLAEQDEKDRALKSKVKMAMIYPTIVLTIMFIIVIGLGWFVLPNLIGVLFSLNVKLPLITRVVIWFSNAFTTYGAVGVPTMVGTFILIGILSKYTRLRVVTQWVMFKIPGIGRLAREATIARFGVILGGLLKAGVPVVEALESLVQVTPIASYKRLYAQMLARVTIGDSFSKCFAGIKGSQKLLPASVQQLVITGEKSGSLADIMLKIADIYDKKASDTAQKLPIILEPMLLLFIGGLVGSIALAIIIPIYSIVGNVGG